MNEPRCPTLKASISDLQEGTCLIFPQFKNGAFLIGLSLEDKICSVDWSDRKKDRTIVVELFKIDVLEDRRYDLKPINLDLRCFLNRNLVTDNVTLPKDCKLEIGDKILRFSDGSRKPRKLPPTPGVLVLPSAPPKPKRDNETEVTDEQIGIEEEFGITGSSGSWQHVPSPGVEFDVIHGVVRNPDQIASVAASHVVRQMMLFTDLKMSVSMMDELYKAFREVVENNREILCEFLSDSKKEMESHRRSLASGHISSQPLHGPVIELLVTLLKYSLEPVSHVILWLLFLRTLSHFTNNLEKLVACQAAAAIMGCMAVFLEVPEIQQFGLEILCKLATYKAAINEKAPVREAGVEMIVRAMKWHDGVLYILRPACRALANLATTFKQLVSQYSETADVSDETTAESIQKWRDLLSFIKLEAVPSVQDCMSVFNRDLGVQTEGRRLLSTLNCAVSSTVRRSSSLGDISEGMADQEWSDDNMEDDDIPGILKNARSFENLRTPTRKVQFTTETIGGAVSNESVSSESVEASSRFDGSGRFMDSFGNEMDMPQAASYIGQDISATNFSNNSGLRKIYIPQSTENTQELNDGHSANSIENDMDSPLPDTKSNKDQFVKQFDGLVAEIDKAVNQTAESEGSVAEIDNTVNQTAESQRAAQSNNNTSKTCQPLDGSEPRPVPAKRSSQKPELVNEAPPPLLPREPIKTELPTMRQTAPPCYTKADVQFLTHLMRTVITGHICSLVLSGQDSQALQAIDQPIGSLLASAKANDFLLLHVTNEYQADKSLMDIDPAMVISIIDAVRYRSLTCDLLKSSLTELIGHLTDRLNHEVSTCAFDSIFTILRDVNLESIFIDKKYLRQIMKSLPAVEDEYLRVQIEELETLITDLL